MHLYKVIELKQAVKINGCFATHEGKFSTYLAHSKHKYNITGHNVREFKLEKSSLVLVKGNFPLPNFDEILNERGEVSHTIVVYAEHLGECKLISHN